MHCSIEYCDMSELLYLTPPTSGCCGDNSGLGDCTQNVTIDRVFQTSLISAITCFRCDFTAEVPIDNIVYAINNVVLDPNDGVIVDGVLVLFELNPPTETVRCTNNINSQVLQVSITVIGKGINNYLSLHSCKILTHTFIKLFF